MSYAIGWNFSFKVVVVDAVEERAPRRWLRQFMNSATPLGPRATSVP